MEKPTPATGFKRLVKAFGYSLEGLRHGVCNEAAFRQEFILFLVLLPVIFFVDCHLLLKALIISGHLLMMIIELLNSALEAIVDKASPEFHPLAKIAKDMGSGAVLLSALIPVIFWCLALANHFDILTI